MTQPGGQVIPFPMGRREERRGSMLLILGALLVAIGLTLLEQARALQASSVSEPSSTSQP